MLKIIVTALGGLMTTMGMVCDGYRVVYRDCIEPFGKITLEICNKLILCQKNKISIALSISIDCVSVEKK